MVVAAVHSNFDLPRKAQTERVIRAMDNRWSILAHPTGRLIGEREPYEIDMERVISAAARARLLPRDQCRAGPAGSERRPCPGGQARRRQGRVSTDAHSADAFEYMRFGIDQARRGWLGAEDVINTRSLPSCAGC